MTDKTQKLDEILAKLPQYNLGQDPITDKDFTPDETFAIYPELAEAKQAILDWHNKQVEEVLDRLENNIRTGMVKVSVLDYIEDERNKLNNSDGDVR